MVREAQVAHTNEYKLLSKMVNDEDSLLNTSLLVLDIPFKSNAVLGYEIQYNTKSIKHPHPHNHKTHTGS